jgi:hypothetical protein
MGRAAPRLLLSLQSQALPRVSCLAKPYDDTLAAQYLPSNMSTPRLIMAVALCAFAACTRTPSPKTLVGEWRQDVDYFQSEGLTNQLGEIEDFEDYELYITDGHLAATRIVGKEPDKKRVYWKSTLAFTIDSAGNHQITFNSHEGQPATATVSFERKHLMVKIGNRRMGFLRDRATNLRIKGYVPKS